jgi:hypothetical protein
METQAGKGSSSESEGDMGGWIDALEIGGQFMQNSYHDKTRDSFD